MIGSFGNTLIATQTQIRESASFNLQHISTKRQPGSIYFLSSGAGVGVRETILKGPTAREESVAANMSSTTANAPTSEGTRGERSHRRKVAFLGPFASYSHQVRDSREMMRGLGKKIEWVWWTRVTLDSGSSYSLFEFGDNASKRKWRWKSRRRSEKIQSGGDTQRQCDMATGICLFTVVFVREADVDLGLFATYTGDKICLSQRGRMGTHPYNDDQRFVNTYY